MTTYRLWPNTPSPTVSAPRANNNTFATEFVLSQDQGLFGIWFYSAPGSAALPSACAVWSVASQAKVSGTENLAPSWSGAAGSGWVKCTYDGMTVLSANARYIVGAYHDASALWRTNTGAYWTTGPGSNGIANGPISAYSSSAASFGQGVTVVGYGFPNSSGLGQNFWVDAEVGAPVVPVPGSASAGNTALRTGVGNTAPAVSAGSSTAVTAHAGSTASTVVAGSGLATSAVAGNAA